MSFAPYTPYFYSRYGIITNDVIVYLELVGTAIAEGRTGVNVGNDATREDVTGPVGHSSSGNRQDPPQKAEGNAATQNEEERHGQTELHRLRAQVGDLVRQQADLLSKATSSSNRPSSSNNSTTAASTTSGWNEC